MRKNKTIIRKSLRQDENRGAEFSRCEKYRYRLWRIWDESKPILVVIGLNPSTATEEKDDPTVRRCIGYARDHGKGGLSMLNIFAFRATNPADMKSQKDPVGPYNNEAIISETTRAIEAGGEALCAWGGHGAHMGRSSAMREILDGMSNIKCLGFTKSGEPLHPLYQRRDAKFISL